MDYCNLNVVISPIKFLISYIIKMTETMQLSTNHLHQGLFYNLPNEICFHIQEHIISFIHLPMGYLNNPSISYTLPTIP